MMNSYSSGYHAAMREAIDEILMQQPEYATVCYQYISALRNNTFDQDLVNAVFQPWERHSVNIYDAYLFLSIWTGLCYGEILWTTLDVGYEPAKDKEIAENNLRLQKLSSKSWVKRTLDERNVAKNIEFQAIFHGGNDIGDGILAWKQPLSVGVVSPFHGAVEVDVGPMSAPLEVGYTRISTTMYHLNVSRCLARWPYNSKLIYIFYCTEEWESASY